MPPIITALFALCSLSRQTLAHCPQSVCSLCSVYLNTSIAHPPHLHIWQPVVCICFEGQSLCLCSDLIRCTDVCPVLSGGDSVNTVCTFHFSRPLTAAVPADPSLPPLPLYRSLRSCLEPAQNLQRSAEATHTFVLSSTHDCDGHVYNVIRLCQTCHRSAVVHLKAIYHDGPVRCWRPAVALSRSVTLISQVLTRRCTWIQSLISHTNSGDLVKVLNSDWLFWSRQHRGRLPEQTWAYHESCRGWSYDLADVHFHTIRPKSMLEEQCEVGMCWNFFLFF